MKIIFTAPIANRRRGDVAELDDGSALLLIGQGYAERVDQDHAEEPAAPTDAPPPAPAPESTTRTRAVPAAAPITQSENGWGMTPRPGARTPERHSTRAPVRVSRSRAFTHGDEEPGRD